MPTALAELTTLRLGGPARTLVEATTEDELTHAVRTADAAGEPLLVVGGGSNLVVGDAGWDGTVVLVRTAGIAETAPDRLTVAAGENWDALVAHTVDAGLSGLAATAGIPGSTGGTPVQNVGAYGTEIADVLTGVRVLDRQTGAVEDWPAARCGFGFRRSVFKHTDRWVVLTVTLALERSPDAPPVRYAELARRLGVELGAAAASKDVRDAVLELRREKGMVLDAADPDTWSVGSFFVNPLVDPVQVPAGCPHWATEGVEKLSAAWLIEHAGFGRGFGLEQGDGRVALSTKHTLALTNRGGATAAELLALAAVIRDGVERRFGIRLRPEAHLVGIDF